MAVELGDVQRAAILVLVVAAVALGNLSIVWREEEQPASS
jgi:hypothetical protein